MEGLSVSNSWQIVESRGIGKEKRHNLTPDGLSIGRSSKADIIVLSNTVDESHAVIEWNSLHKKYTIKDLNTENGTLVNQQLLRDSTKTIEQGDSLRFGHDTDQVFRVEVVSHNPIPSSPTPPPPVYCCTANTTVVKDHSSSTQYTSTTTTSDITLITSTSYPSVPSPLPPVVPSYPTAGSVSPIRCVPIAHTFLVPVATPPTHPQQHQGGVAVTTSIPVATPIPIVTTMSQTIPEISATTVDSPSTLTQPSQQPLPISSDKDSNKANLRVRIDGRKSVPWTRGSPLYGVPSWWGQEDSYNEEEEEMKESVKSGRIIMGAQHQKQQASTLTFDEENQMPYSDSELIPRKSGTQIMRELDDTRVMKQHRRKASSRRMQVDSLTSISSNVLPHDSLESSSVLSADEINQSICSVEADQNRGNTSTSFTVEFDPPVKRRRKPPNLSSKRPASYAAGLSNLEKSSKPPIIPERKRNIAMVTPSRKNSKKPVSEKSFASNTRESSSVSLTESKASSTTSLDTIETIKPMDEISEPPSTSNLDELIAKLSSSQLTDKPLGGLQSQSDVLFQPPTKSHSQPGSVQGTPYGVIKPLDELHSQSDILFQPPIKSRSQPGSVRGTPYAASEPSISRPGSARKQWMVDNEVPHSLIIASIESRLSRLADSAKKTTDNVRCVMESARKEGHVFDNQGVVDATVSGTNLPVWKIMNKEYQNICKHLAKLERSLKDINAMIVSEETSSGEQVDFQPIEVIDELEDSIENERDRRGLLANVVEEHGEIYSMKDEVIQEVEDSNEVITIRRNLDYDGDNDLADESSSDDDEYFSVSSDPAD